MNDTQSFTPEYIHQIVSTFADDFINRRLYLRDVSDKPNPNVIIEQYGKFGKLMRDKYFDVKIIGNERAKVERELFDYILGFTTFNLILPSKFSDISIETRIDKLERRLESTNKLLRSIIDLLREIKKKTDKL